MSIIHVVPRYLTVCMVSNGRLKTHTHTSLNSIGAAEDPRILMYTTASPIERTPLLSARGFLELVFHAQLNFSAS